MSKGPGASFREGVSWLFLAPAYLLASDRLSGTQNPVSVTLADTRSLSLKVPGIFTRLEGPVSSLAVLRELRSG